MFNRLAHDESEKEIPYISVIVTAHNRKEFIVEAVNSVINQTLERGKYEIIVVKNYLDVNIDKFLKENKIINIYTDEVPLAAKIANGIKESRGEVICLLEDDDLFLPIKLYEIYNTFHKNNKIILVRNNILETMCPDIIKKSMKVNSKNFCSIHEISIASINSVQDIYFILKKYSISNNSSISLRKDFYVKSLGFLKDVNYFVEPFLFFFGIFNGNNNNIIIFQEQILSIYRIHNSWMHVSVDQSLDNFIEHNLLLAYQGMNDFERYKTFFLTNVILKKYFILSTNELIFKIKLIKGEKINSSELILLIKHYIWSRSSSIFLYVPLFFISFINRSYASTILNKILKKVQTIPVLENL